MTSREWHEADQDDADRVRDWQPRTALESLAGQAIEVDCLHPAQDAQEPEPEPAPCNCHEHLVYRASLAFNSDREREFALEGDPIDLWNRLAAVTAQLVAALDIIALHEANIARLTYDRNHPYGEVAL